MIEKKRLEELWLPTWEEIKEKKSFVFFHYKGYLGYITPESYIFVDDYGDWNFLLRTIFNKPLTKENYIEACELCKKLFLGEEV